MRVFRKPIMHCDPSNLAHTYVTIASLVRAHVPRAILCLTVRKSRDHYAMEHYTAPRDLHAIDTIIAIILQSNITFHDPHAIKH